MDSLGPENWVSRFTTGQEMSFLLLVADPIITNDPSTRALQGRLVSSWSFQKNGSDNVWDFKMPSNIVANEGKGAFTSADIQFNFSQMLMTDAKSSLSPVVRLLVDSDIKNFEIVSPTEFKLHSTKFDAASPASLALGTAVAVMQPKAYSEAAGDSGYNSHPIGTGSYIFKAGQKQSKYTVEAVPNHWRKTANVQTVNLMVVPEVATRLAMLKTGQVDMGTMNKQSKSQLTGDLRPYSIRNQSLSFVALGGMYYNRPDKNCTTCPWVGFTDKPVKVRQALTLAIDRQAIADKLLFGEATLAALPFVWPPGPYSYVDPSWQVPAYDPAQAKSLLAQAGYPNGFSIQFPILSLGGFPEMPDVAQAVASYWGAIGIDVKQQAMDFSPTWVTNMQNRTTAGYAWVLFNQIKDDPFPDLRRLFSKDAVVDYLEDPKVDEYIAKAANETDPAKRAQFSKELGQYFIDQRIGIPLFGINGIWGLNSKVVSWNNITGFQYLGNVETIAMK